MVRQHHETMVRLNVVFGNDVYSIEDTFELGILEEVTNLEHEGVRCTVRSLTIRPQERRRPKRRLLPPVRLRSYRVRMVEINRISFLLTIPLSL